MTNENKEKNPSGKDKYYRVPVLLTLSKENTYTVWASSEQEAEELVEAQIEDDYFGFNIDNIEIGDLSEK